MKNNRPKTIFCDLDGVLVEHNLLSKSIKPSHRLKLLPKTIEKLEEWESKGYNIILTTGRKESMRYSTQNQLFEAGIFYDQLIMGIGGGTRVLINDTKPDGSLTVECFCPKRNKGIGDINV